MKKSEELGAKSIGRLLIQQSVPAAIGVLVLSIYGIADTIFVGRFVSSEAIAAIGVVTPLGFLMSSIGMAIGVGGASTISRAFGEKNFVKAQLTFDNQKILCILLTVGLVLLSFIFENEILQLFGAEGSIMPLAKSYFRILLPGIPFLAWAMMCNSVIRAEGYPKASMLAMIIPALINVVFDPLFIIVFDGGIEGAAWATTLSYVICAFYTIYFFLRNATNVKISIKNISLNKTIQKEITSIGAVTLARQSSVSLLAIVLNNLLFEYYGSTGISVYSIITKIIMFASFPIFGLGQGFAPIVGFNYGANNFKRVVESIKVSMVYGTLLAFGVSLLIIVFRNELCSVFSHDASLVDLSSEATMIVFIGIPLTTIQIIGTAYFQATGKAKPALFLTLTRQVLLIIPLVYLLPIFFGKIGIWYAFPVSDVLATIITVVYLASQLAREKRLIPQSSRIN